MDQTTYLMEDEIDLRQYIVVLLKYWYWLIGLAGLAAIVAFIVTSFLPKTYEAQADVLILETKTEITLDPKYQTVFDELDAKNNQQTLISLVKSSDVAATMLAQNGELLPAESTVKSLLERVTTSNNSNIISIVVSGQSPEQAANLGTLWAATYIDYINHLYNTQNETLLVEVKKQVSEVQQRYQTVQTALETFLADNQIDRLSREIKTRKQQARELRQRSADLETTPLFLFDQQQKTQRQILADKYSQLKRLDGWLVDAAALQAQLEANPARANQPENQLALLLLRSQMAGSSNNVQLQLNPADLAGQPLTPADIEQLMAGLRQQQQTLTHEIEQLSANLLAEQSGPEALTGPKALTGLLAQLDGDIRSLNAELEAQQAHQRELTKARDLAWESLNTVQRKVAEVELSSQMTNARVRNAGTALPPQDAVGPRRLVNTAIAGALGLMLSVFAVFALEWWREGTEQKPPPQE